MLNTNDLISSLPPYPAYRGKWASLYLEPMMASGERLTVAIAACGDDGDFKVYPAMRRHVIDAMFGGKSEAFNKLIEIACASLSHHLSTYRDFEGWAAPTSGLTMGRVRETVSSDLAGLLRQAVCMTASLAALDFDSDQNSSSERQIETVDRWSTQFKDAVLARQPKLSGYFNQNHPVSDRARPIRMFYLSEQVAINTGRLEPGSHLPRFLLQNKAGLIDLASVRNNPGRLLARKHFELIVFRPKLDDPLYSTKQIDSLSEAMLTLELLGKEHGLIVATVESADQAANRLFLAEEAA